MLMPLTDIQRNVFNALANYYVEHDFPPTARELARAVGKATVSNELAALRKKGWALKLENQHVRNTCPSSEALEKLNKEDS
ncbi:MAG: SOS-response transcriptional repressor LexA [Cocleimonas sp.]|jgi:SOS-response transcriptional repressor LexA